MSDGFLVRQYRAGSADAATQLYFRYADHLLNLTQTNLAAGLASRVGAEDIVQSVFRTFFRRAQLGLYEVPQGENLWRLQLVIALNKVRTAASFHGAARRDLRRTTTASGSPPAGADGRAENALTILKLVIEELLQPLPPSSRTIIEMRIDGFQVEEISKAVQRSKRTVERVLRGFQDHLAAAVSSPKESRE